jgi:hypothetical protein
VIGAEHRAGPRESWRDSGSLEVWTGQDGAEKRVEKLENRPKSCTYWTRLPLFLPSGPTSLGLTPPFSGVGLSAALLTVAEMGKDPWGGVVGEFNTVVCNYSYRSHT